MINSVFTCKRGIIFFSFFIFTYWSWPILWVLSIIGGLVSRSGVVYFNNGYCIFRVCIGLRSNKVMGCYCYY